MISSRLKNGCRHWLGMVTLAVSGSFLLLGCSAATETADVQNPADARPNILLIMADDLGYSDLGFLGGEIDTPVLDSLAADSTYFTNFYAGPQCGPTRMELLSGADNNQAAVGEQGGYHLSTDLPTIADVLKGSGYETIMAGKWDVGWGEGLTPSERGFDQSFALLPGAADHYNQTQHVAAKFKGEPLNENGEQVRPDDYFSTETFTDKLVEYVGNRKYPEKPAFIYASYTAPHWPLQADPELVAKYQDMYLRGYAAIASQRVTNLKQSDLSMLVERPYLADFSRWESLSEQERRYEARQMAIYAAMTDHMDQQIQRLLEQLDAQGELDNTIVMFLSDNGADESSNDNVPVVIAADEEIDNSYDNLGQVGSYNAYGPLWAEVSSTPFRGVKMQSLEGGIRVPAFIRMPGDKAGMTITHARSGIKDFVQTIFDFAEVPDSRRSHLDNLVVGKSLLPVLLDNQPQVRGDDEYMVVSYTDRYSGKQLAAVFRGDWKLVGMAGKGQPLEWALYNLSDDPGETRDLSAEEPEMLAQLNADWDDYQARLEGR